MWRRKRTTSPTSTSTSSVTSATTTTSTTVTTSTTTVPAVTVPATGRRGDLMGISAGPYATTAVLDGILTLGLKWVRVSHEAGWLSGPGSLDALQATVTEAHARGLKVLQCVQLAGHTYTSTDARTLADFAVRCASTGIDALEVFNEANNPPFWQPQAFPPALCAQLTATIGAQVRSLFPTLPIITNGLSPAAQPYTASTWWPAFWDAYPAGHIAGGYTAAGLHPYVYPENPCTLMDHPEWNPWACVQPIRTAMTARGVNLQLWFTEIGCPGFGAGAPVVRGIALDETRQQFVTEQYLKQWVTLGKPGEPLFIATLQDGMSQTTALEGGLGLLRSDGSKKPAWWVVHDHAALPL